MRHAPDPAGRSAAPAGSPRPDGPAEDPRRTERVLILAAQRGDEAAFVALYRQYAERIYRYCVLRTGSHADAEDILQQTFVRIVQGLPAYRDRGLPFGAWVFRIARNALLDHMRRSPDHAPLDVVPVDLRDHAPDPAHIVGDRDSIVRALRTLTPDQRDVIAYRFFADLTTREIGALMGRDETAVRVLQSRALASLRRHLERPVPALGALSATRP